MARGGKRIGAGRPKGLGKYKEPTKAVRVPVSIIPHIDNFLSQNYKLPLYSSKVSAGFPSPAEDYISDRLDLNEYLIKHPAATVGTFKDDEKKRKKTGGGAPKHKTGAVLGR